MHPLARLDRKYVWHPFTQMRDWMKVEPRVIVRGRGAILTDAHGNRYIDANSSIWTNLHGHQNPTINRAIRQQLTRISHSSALGLANEPASLLASELILSARLPRRSQPRLTKVFFSDDGSTALEVALKLAWEFSRRCRGLSSPRFLSMQGAYHGDTVGAVSLGHIDLFHSAFGDLLFKTDAVMAPFCYRCPFNRARPERADARLYRRCDWECVSHVEAAFDKARKSRRPYAAMVVEPRIQGAAGMIPQPASWLRRVSEIARAHDALLIADEVMTAFGRTGAGRTHSPFWFASHHEGVQPDFLCVAKGLSGGYLPLAATLTTQPVFDAFLGEYPDFKTFFHGHSFTGNQLGSAAALANLSLLRDPEGVRQRVSLEQELTHELSRLWAIPAVGDIRQVGLVAGVELVRDWTSREPFPLSEQVGFRVCDHMARHGVLTRPVGNVIVLMPPYCTTARQVRRIVDSLAEAILETL